MPAHSQTFRVPDWHKALSNSDGRPFRILLVIIVRDCRPTCVKLRDGNRSDGQDVKLENMSQLARSQFIDAITRSSWYECDRVNGAPIDNAGQKSQTLKST